MDLPSDSAVLRIVLRNQHKRLHDCWRRDGWTRKCGRRHHRIETLRLSGPHRADVRGQTAIRSFARTSCRRIGLLPILLGTLLRGLDSYLYLTNLSFGSRHPIYFSLLREKRYTI